MARRPRDDDDDSRREFGSIRKRGKTYQARYVGANLQRYAKTFPTYADADGWLTTAEREMHLGIWEPPGAVARQAKVARLTFAAYAEEWLTRRDLKPRTRNHYRNILDAHLIPKFGSQAVAAITAEEVRDWYAALLRDKPTMRAHVYALLRTILTSAVAEDVIDANPAKVRGAGTSRRASKTEPATLGELEAIAKASGEKWGTMVLLAAWCALRFGELAELRRKDVVVEPEATDEEGEALPRRGVIRVRRGVVRVEGQHIVGDPKSEAGIRDVAIPPHLVPALETHLARFTEPGPEGLLFAADRGYLTPTTLYRWYYPAREAAGRPDLRFHDLRHTGAVLAAQTGATLAELMSRLGHSTPAAAMRYQHAARDRDGEIARLLSDLASGKK